MKVTERKFYRVSGSSTHYNGIIPDIEYPAPSDMPRPDRFGGAIGGRGSDVAPIRHASAQRFGPHVEALQRRHEERVANNPDFAYLRARGEYLDELRARTEVSLSEETRLAEKAADDAWVLRLENQLLAARGEEPVASIEELDELGVANLGPEEPETDVLVQETANILVDYLDLSRGIALADGGAKATVQ